MLWHVSSLVEYAQSVKVNKPPKGWVPLRPNEGYDSLKVRIKSAWLVLTGKADAVVWDQGD